MVQVSSWNGWEINCQRWYHPTLFPEKIAHEQRREEVSVITDKVCHETAFDTLSGYSWIAPVEKSTEAESSKPSDHFHPFFQRRKVQFCAFWPTISLILHVNTIWKELSVWAGLYSYLKMMVQNFPYDDDVLLQKLISGEHRGLDTIHLVSLWTVIWIFDLHKLKF